jgi:hypothetical protein
MPPVPGLSTPQYIFVIPAAAKPPGRAKRAPEDKLHAGTQGRTHGPVAWVPDLRGFAAPSGMTIKLDDGY